MVVLGTIDHSEYVTIDQHHEALMGLHGLHELGHRGALCDLPGERVVSPGGVHRATEHLVGFHNDVTSSPLTILAATGSQGSVGFSVGNISGQGQSTYRAVIGLSETGSLSATIRCNEFVSHWLLL